ncbi:MAG: recombinase family protein [Acidimicrobiia bacterium]|nr:recombinase family protein [Acidimicrobiia bacterium]MBT8214230.1 recombinase family protein [Acidimicrobiia bacterium]NNF69766.1 recombinase family protein [Acidimicrobiia bacterium]NNK92442.1 recombinase family protein [Acidimicrobiia bacterium]
MRIIGYVREGPGPQSGDPAFAQAEKIRRWATDAGHRLVAVCQDIKSPGHALGREGYRALIGIISAGQVDGVVVSSIDALSADTIVQEVMIWDLRNRGMTVMSARAEDHELLGLPVSQRARLLIQDVLARVVDYQEMIAAIQPAPASIDAPDEEIIIELVEQDTATGN